MTHWKTTNKKNPYIFKRNTSIMIVYHRLSDYTSEHKDLLQGKGVTGLATINNRTNVLVYIAKQDRYRIIRGYFTPYQIEEAIKPIREKYEHLVEADIKELSKHKPYFFKDISDIPPDMSYQSDETWTFEGVYFEPDEE